MRAGRAISALTRYTLLEAVRTKLPWATCMTLAILFGLAIFVREISLAQGHRMQIVTYAALARPAVILIVALHVCASLVREFNDRGLDLVLALDVPRWQYLAGRYAGYATVATAAASLAAAPLALLAGPLATAPWFASLALETCLVAALAMFCTVTLVHLPSAMAFIAGFYVLARALGGLQLIADSSPPEGISLFHEAGRILIWALTLVLPPLDVWTRAAWLLDDMQPGEALGIVAIQASVYVVLLLTAALTDFYRRRI